MTLANKPEACTPTCPFKFQASLDYVYYFTLRMDVLSTYSNIGSGKMYEKGLEVIAERSHQFLVALSILNSPSHYDPMIDFIYIYVSIYVRVFAIGSSSVNSYEQ